jgi:excisionase family DNA binding protein
VHKNKFISEVPLAERGLRPPISHGGKASHERLMLSISEVGFLLGIGRTSVYGLIKRGDLRSFKLGARTLVPTEDVLRFAAQLSAR